MSAIDPGIDSTIEANAERVESSTDHNQSAFDQGGLHCSSRWWFASTICPLLAATFGPLASAFSICALVFSWRVYIPPIDGSADHGIPLTDPPWLLAINAISLVSALVANASLLLNMTRRLHFSIAQPITIVGFFVSGVLLVADMAALAAMPAYGLTSSNVPNHPDARLPGRHALTEAFYYAIFAAAMYVIIGLLMCLTVYGARAGHYDKHFRLTPSQRTLMLQTMSFIAYLLLSAWVFSTVEDWTFLDAVYWADVTLLTIGFGDMSPSTRLGRGLPFPFAIGGILMIGLVIGSIRSLILERGKEKLEARIVEKKRAYLVNNFSPTHQAIRIGYFTKATFAPDPALSTAQRREAEFYLMRKVQSSSERERRWTALAISLASALTLWFAGAAVFQQCERAQQWTYFQSLYMSYTALLTIGYGDFSPASNSGRSFFVFWSLLAVPSLTILISNMGDTIVRAFTQATDWLGSLTVLPGERSGSARASLKQLSRVFSPRNFWHGTTSGSSPKERIQPVPHDPTHRFNDYFTNRLRSHVSQAELQGFLQPRAPSDDLERDFHFYHHVLAREIRSVQRGLGGIPETVYSWEEWEYFLRLVGNEERGEKVQREPKGAVEDSLLAKGPFAGEWSWLGERSPLMCEGEESEWVLEALSRALERGLGRRREGEERRPPVGFADFSVGGLGEGREG